MARPITWLQYKDLLLALFKTGRWPSLRLNTVDFAVTNSKVLLMTHQGSSGLVRVFRQDAEGYLHRDEGFMSPSCIIATLDELNDFYKDPLEKLAEV